MTDYDFSLMFDIEHDDYIDYCHECEVDLYYSQLEDLYDYVGSIL